LAMGERLVTSGTRRRYTEENELQAKQTEKVRTERAISKCIVQ